jgi:hypothetical protein
MKAGVSFLESRRSLVMAGIKINHTERRSRPRSLSVLAWRNSDNIRCDDLNKILAASSRLRH